MIEMKSNSTGGWKPLDEVMYYDPDPPQVKNFTYRINGIVYTKRNKEFLVVWNEAVMWYRLQNPTYTLQKKNPRETLKKAFNG